MRFQRYIVFFLVMLVSVTLFAKPKKKQNADSQPLTRTEVLTEYYLMEAISAWNMKDYGRAFSLFYYVHDLNPQDAATCSYLSTLVNGELAMQWKKQAYENDPVAYWENYAEALSKQKRWKEAKEVITHAAKLKPKDGYVWECLAEACMQMDEYKNALKALQKQETLDGLTEDITRNRIVCLLKTGKLKQALQTVEEYQQAHPEDEQFAIMKASIYLNINEFAKCKRELERLQTLYPENPFVYLELADYYHTLCKYGIVVIEDEYITQEKEAQAIYKATQIESWNVWHKSYIVKRNLQLLAKYDLAETILNSLEADYPTEEQVTQLQVAYYESVNDSKNLRKYLRKQTELNPENAEAWDEWIETLTALTAINHEDSVLGNEQKYVVEEGYKRCNSLKWSYLKALLYVLDEQKEQAITLLTTDLQKGEQEAKYKFAVWSLLGDLYMSTEQLDLAYEAYEQALTLDPDNVYVLNNYAFLLADNGGDLKKAEKMSQKTILAEPNNPTYLDTYAWILYLQGQQNLAEFYIKKAMRNMGNATDDELTKHYNTILNITE